MYTLTRNERIIKDDNGETIYKFKFVETVGDRFRYQLLVFRTCKDSLGDLRIPSAEYDIIVRGTSELNTLFNNPEYAHEYIDKEACGYTFMYFEFQLPDEKHSKAGIGTLYSSFDTYVDIRRRFPGLARNGVIITSLEKESCKFNFDDHRPVYMGYCFTDNEDTWERHKDTILELAKDFSLNEKDDDE